MTKRHHGGLRVAQKHRTSHLSFIPGGYDVRIWYHKGAPMIYDHVHYPFKYWEKARNEDPNVKSYEILGESKILS